MYESVYSKIHESKKMPNYIYCGTVRFEYDSPKFCCGNRKIRKNNKISPVINFYLEVYQYDNHIGRNFIFEEGDILEDSDILLITIDFVIKLKHLNLRRIVCVVTIVYQFVRLQ